MSVATTVLETHHQALLGRFYEAWAVLAGSFGTLLGIVALLVWGYATGLAVLFGLACAAQLEAERAGKREPARAT
jgi:uncharacterized BrkB/YihY/UPF0761 family membrane protein